jgi:hypothetical protein
MMGIGNDKRQALVDHDELPGTIEPVLSKEGVPADLAVLPDRAKNSFPARHIPGPMTRL